jgi:hypothetical protein
MPDRQPIPEVEDDQIDGAVLALLTTNDGQRPWSEDEIARELKMDPSDSLNRLYGSGLIHRLHGFVWASRAALLAGQIAV